MNNSEKLFVTIKEFSQEQRGRYGKGFLLVESSDRQQITLLTKKQQDDLETRLRLAGVQDLKIQSVEKSAGEEMVVKTSGLGVYTKPSFETGVLADQLWQGERVRCLSIPKSDWVAVAIHHDFEDKAPMNVGWVHGIDGFVSAAQKKEDTTIKTALREVVNEWIDAPYLLSGKSKQGIDCSGLVQMITHSVSGLWLPRLSRWQFLVGETVERADLKSGDLVFIRDEKFNRVDHVGMVLGTTSDSLPLVVHSSSRNGGVKVEDWSSTTWLGKDRKIAGYNRI